jgi:hypothetical protein
MRFLLKTILLTLFCASAFADPDPGLWYDPARPGSGLSLHRSGNTYFASVFEYDADSRPVWYFASNVVYDGELDPGGPVFSGKLYVSTGTPMTTPQHQFFAPVEVGRISMWQFKQFQPAPLTMEIYFPPLCPTCPLRVTTRSYVRLM